MEEEVLVVLVVVVEEEEEEEEEEEKGDGGGGERGWRRRRKVMEEEEEKGDGGGSAAVPLCRCAVPPCRGAAVLLGVSRGGAVTRVKGMEEVTFIKGRVCTKAWAKTKCSSCRSTMQRALRLTTRGSVCVASQSAEVLCTRMCIQVQLKSPGATQIAGCN
jgi:hypothetical protein